MSEKQRTIFMDRYSKRDATGKPTETWADACDRVSRVVASVADPPASGGSGQDPLARRGSLAHRVAPDVFGPDETLRDLFCDMIYNMEFLPNTPTWTGASDTLREDGQPDTDGQLAACFVLDMRDSLSSIMGTISDAVQIQKRGGGNGFPLHFLRPEGAIISKSRGKSTGPVGFLRAKDKMYGEIEQGGVRRGANMAVMMVWHPDVLKFIRCKNLDVSKFTERHQWFALLAEMARLGLCYQYTDEAGKEHDVSFDRIYRGFVQHMSESQITNFNISVGITDEFMRAVEQDKLFKLHFDGFDEFDREMPARDIMNAIAENAHKNGEPGVLFMDAANACRVIEHMLFEATNPCGEQYLFANGTCTLGSVNFAKFFCRGAGKRVDWALRDIDFYRLKRTVILATIFLDCVVSANRYVSEVPKVRETAERYRNIGLGPMGVADLLFAMGVRYGSGLSVYAVHVLMAHFQYWATFTSIGLARELGAFPAYKGSRFDRADPLFYSGMVRNNGFFAEGVDVPEMDMRWPNMCETYEERIAYEGSASVRREKNSKFVQDCWGDLCKEYGDLAALCGKYGMRNVTVTTVAPTGTISNVAGLLGGGCEPAYALQYTRTMKDQNQQLVYLSYMCDAFKDALAEVCSDGEMETIKQQVVQNSGSCQGIAFFNGGCGRSIAQEMKEIEDTFVVANDLTGNTHVIMQAAFQYWISNSTSKTCNLPASTAVQGIVDIYMLAWRMGCKGCTVYRNGSRAFEVLSTVKVTENKKGKADEARDVEERHDNKFVQRVEEVAQVDDSSKLALSLMVGENGAAGELAKIAQRKKQNIYYGRTICHATKFGDMRITVNYDEHGPFEVLILIGKAGSELLATVEGYGRAASILLQSTSDGQTRLALLKRLVKQWKGIGGGESHGFGRNRFISLPDCIARCVDQVVFGASDEEDGDDSKSSTPVEDVELVDMAAVKFSGDCCPECHMMSVVHQEGCAKCTLCPYSKCS